MRTTITLCLFGLFLMTSLTCTRVALAEDANSRASDAVSNILFDYDATEFTTYSINDDGFVDITFAKNTPDALYSQILDKLQNDPNINGVLAGKGGPTCPLF